MTTETVRYQLFASSGPWSHRATLVVALAGLTDVVSVSYRDDGPALWDGERIASDDITTLDADLATAFPQRRLDLYPDDLRLEIDAFDRWLDRKTQLDRDTLVTLDRSVAGERYLLGDRLTLADVRLFVRLVRYDGRLADYPDLWAYARNLYQQAAFRETTSFDHPASGWDEPAVRYLRAS